MYSKSDICNLALSRLGDKKTVKNIDDPSESTEKTFAKWYDITRRAALRAVMPNFAQTRSFWAKSDQDPEWGYAHAYKYRSDCLKILGVGNLYQPRNDYSVENGYILIDDDFPKGLPVRYIQDIVDIDRFDDNFIELFSMMLAYNVCPEVTESVSMLQYLEKAIAYKTTEVIGVNSQENKPIRVCQSRLKRARLGFGNGVIKA